MKAAIPPLLVHSHTPLPPAPPPTPSSLAAGADPKVQSKTGWSVLHYCAQNDAIESAAEVFRFVENVQRMRAAELAAFVNLRDERERTALHIAAFRADTALVKLLIAKGADVHAVEKAGHTPCALAGKAKNGPNKAYLEKLCGPDGRAGEAEAGLHVEETPPTASALSASASAPALLAK